VSKLKAFLRERAAIGDASSPMLEGGASFAYVFGKVLVFLFIVEGLTGAALSAFYSPSTTDAWASVAYIQDQSAMGWLVRGVHHHGGAAIVIVAGLHLIQTAIAGAYKKPRELVWWLGVLLLLLTLAWAVTGYVLRWDQEGYWANRVELGIAAGTPVVGGAIKDLALGGNDYGNLTLTRFYALHVVVLPAIVLLLTVAHIWIARRHGITPVAKKPAAPRWPDQSLRDAFAMLVVCVLLLGHVGYHHGVGLTAPADPSQAFDARPLWYFRWLYELRELSGSAEKIVALVVPGIVGGFLIMLPMLDKSSDRHWRARKLWVGALAGLFAAIGGLTVMSFMRDSGDAELGKRREAAVQLADKARALAKSHGVPASGALDVYNTAPFAKARKLFAQKCSGCHVDPKERKGPLIGPGHGNRAWLEAFLLDPSGDLFWGRTKLAKDSKLAQENEAKKPAPDAGSGSAKPDDKKEEPKKPDGPQDLAMKPVELKKGSAELTSVVEYLYGLSGATDVDKQKADMGKAIFDSTCNDCHTVAEGAQGGAGPNLANLGHREYYVSFISNPKSNIHMTPDMSSMPRFDKELTIVERDLIAEYLVWLRTATQADVDALEPLH
jgi:ubiquinol-cytochrome c reductase cytochrome b subunit